MTIPGAQFEGWRLLAQSMSAVADHLDNAVGFQLTPIVIANLPPSPKAGMIACVTNSTVRTWGSTISSTGVGGPFTVLVWYNGSNWTVVGQ